MVVGNFMNISQISPKEGFKWFMEFRLILMNGLCIKCFRYGFCVTGGKTMKTIYIIIKLCIKNE